MAKLPKPAAAAPAKKISKASLGKAGKQAANNIGLVKDVMHSGGVYRGAGGKFISKKEAQKQGIEPEFHQVISKSPINASGIETVAESMQVIAGTLKEINTSIVQKLSKNAYTAEEAALERRPEKRDAVKVKDQGGAKADISSLVSNPAFLAALSGIVYTVLPKDVQDKFKALFGGFINGLDKGSSSFGELGTAVKVAAGGLGLFLGSKFVSSILDMTANLIGIGKRLGRKGIIAAGAVAAVAATEYVKSKKEDKAAPTGEDGGVAPEPVKPEPATPSPSPAAAPQPAVTAPRPAATQESAEPVSTTAPVKSKVNNSAPKRREVVGKLAASENISAAQPKPEPAAPKPESAAPPAISDEAKPAISVSEPENKTPPAKKAESKKPAAKKEALPKANATPPAKKAESKKPAAKKEALPKANATPPSFSDKSKTGKDDTKATKETDPSKYIKLANSSVDLSNLSPAVKTRLAEMGKEFEQRTGRKIQINSGYRNPKMQAELYAKYGSPRAAKPGKSWHERGMAFDMQSSDADEAIKLGLFKKYGFKRPVQAEPWHIEATETRGGSLPDNPVVPGAPVAVPDKSGKPTLPATGKEDTKLEKKEDKKKKVSQAEPVEQTASLSSIQASRDKINKPYEYTPSAEGSNLQSQIALLQKEQGISDAELYAQIEKNDGKAIAQMTQDVKQKTTAAKQTAPIINTIDMSSTKGMGGKKSYDAPPPIPSPIADRGSLNIGVSHSTSY
jgi:uncharacterized protein YcbK (DUF882 family)